MIRRPLRSRARPRGFAIVLVLWLMVLLATIGIHLTGVGRTELRIAANIAASARAEALADGGVAEAVFWLGDSDPERRWLPDGEPHRLVHGRDRITVTVTDESGKLNPNLAPEQLTAALLREVGAESDKAGAIAGAIAARARPSAGSTPATATPAGTPLGTLNSGGTAPSPAGAPQQPELPIKFEALDELLDIPGMTPDLFARLRPHISIDATSPIPKLEAADPIVARVVTAYRSAAGTDVSADPSRGNAAPDQGQQQQSATILSIVSVANADDTAAFVREAVVRLDPKVAKGYIALRWARRDADDTDVR